MSKGTWEVTEQDVIIAKAGLITQAEARGIQVDDEKMVEWVDHTAQVIASYHAQARFLQNVIHRQTG